MLKATVNFQASPPKGLRFGYGIHALQSGVPLNMLLKWMGHTDMSTAAIYTDASGEEESVLAQRMWCVERQMTLTFTSRH